MKIPIILLLFLFAFQAYAQPQPLRIMDFVIFPAIELDSVTGIPLDTTRIDFKINFKISDASQASQLRLLAGTTQNSGDVLDVTSGFVFSNGKYCINHNGTEFPVNGYAAGIKLSMTKQQEAEYNYITLYVIGNAGNETNRLNFTR